MQGILPHLTSFRGVMDRRTVRITLIPEPLARMGASANRHHLTNAMVGIKRKFVFLSCAETTCLEPLPGSLVKSMHQLGIFTSRCVPIVPRAVV